MRHNSVIHIDNAEQTFYKKVPKAEKSLDPKRLKKILPKQLKEIKKEKRIIIIGTSSNPFEGFFYIPDYTLTII